MIGGHEGTRVSEKPVSGEPYQTTTDAGDAASATAWLELQSGQRFSIGTDCSLGRSRNNHIVLPNERVSRCHAQIQIQEAKTFCLSDLGSSNGTWLNGKRITQPVEIFDQDRLQVGTFTMVFRQPDGPARSKTPPANRTPAEPKSTTCWLLLASYGSTRATAVSKSDDADPAARVRWLDGCQQIIEQRGGCVGKYLTGGFLAVWQDRPGMHAAVGHALTEMTRLEPDIPQGGRIVLHHGNAVMGGSTLLSGSGISGTEVSFVYRADHLAENLKASLLVSDAARAALGDALKLVALGSHPVSGFEGEFAFFRI